MKTRVLIFAFAIIALASCSFFNPYGKKVKINEYVEVYYKGENTKEEDAKKLGDYIATTWKDQTNQKSFQLTKDKDVYVVRMVVDTEKLKADTSLNASFNVLRLLISTQAFNNSKVRLILTDNQFKDVKTFEETSLETSDKIENPVNTDTIKSK